MKVEVTVTHRIGNSVEITKTASIYDVVPSEAYSILTEVVKRLDDSFDSLEEK